MDRLEAYPTANRLAIPGRVQYDGSMTRSLGKSMQILALMLLPAAMLMQLTSALRNYSLSVMLLLMLFGIALFGLGRILEGYGSPRAE